MKGFLISALIWFSLLSAAVGGERQAGPGSIAELVSAVVSYFPKVQGVVRDADGDRLILSLSKKEGLKPGMRLELWREGSDILHPTTGAVIGKTEERIGSADVTEVGEIASKAIVTKRLKPARQGDIARINPKRLSIAIIPVRSERREVVSEISERLSDSGRFSLVDQRKVDEYIKNRAEMDSGLIREMAAALGLDTVLTVGVYPEDRGLLVAAKIYYGDDGRLLSTITATLDAKEIRPSFGEIRPFFASREEDVDDIPGIPFHARLAAVSDLDGDGVLEWVLSDGWRLHVFREELAGWRGIWEEKVDVKAKIQYLNIDIADINGNGRPEIFATAVKNGAATSYVIEFTDGTYRTISEVHAVMRVIEHPIRGRMLIGQDISSPDFPGAWPKQYVWSAGSYSPAQEVHLPAGVSFYGFVFADLAGPAANIVARDADDRLIVYAGDSIVWKSEERYPGQDMHVEVGGARLEIKPRLLALDIDGDGRHEVILAENGKKALFRGYKTSHLYGLKWTGEGFVHKWEMRDIPGATLDMCVQGEVDRSVVRLLVKRPFGLFHYSKTFMTSYRTAD